MPDIKAEVTTQTAGEVLEEHAQAAADAAAEAHQAKLVQLGYETIGEPHGVLSQG